MSENLIICVSAGSEIGSGHVFRCLALADRWLKKKGNVLFVGHLPGNFQSILKKKRHRVSHIESVKSIDFHIRNALDLYQKSVSGWIVLDGYGFESKHYEKIKRSGAKLLVIDDTVRIQKYRADILLNQNPYAEELKYSVNPGCIMLSGSKYALLREDFKLRRPPEPSNPAQVSKIMITMGGADPDNITQRIIESFNSVLQALTLVIVLGPSNRHKKKISHSVKQSVHNCEIHDAVSDMAELMMQVDFTITAAGSTCWELCCLGVPFSTVIIAGNQEKNARFLDHHQIACCLGYGSNIDKVRSGKQIARILQDHTNLVKRMKAGFQSVDGSGPDRIVREMTITKILLKAAEEKDCRPVWELSNDPLVREASFDSGLIPFSRHEKWFKKRLEDLDHDFYIAYSQNQKKMLGQVRFDIRNREARISVSLGKEHRQKGFGARIISSGLEKVMERRKLRRIFAEIKPGNQASINAFQKAGFYRTENPGSDKFISMVFENKSRQVQ